MGSYYRHMIKTLLERMYGNRYRVNRISEEKPCMRMVELVCGGFFVVDYFIKIYR